MGSLPQHLLRWHPSAQDHSIPPGRYSLTPGALRVTAGREEPISGKLKFQVPSPH